MKRTLVTTVYLSLTLTAVFFAGYWLAQSPYAPVQLYGPAVRTPDAAEEAFAPFWEVFQLIHARYFDQPLDNDRLVEGAINGMLEALDDPNTRYLSPQDEESARQMLAGEFEGIGAEVESVDGGITIVSPYEGSPAAAAGLLPGDILRQANGTDLTGMDVGEAAALVRGPAGTVVHLVVERDGELFEVDVTRAVINIPSVYGEVLDNNLAYVRLNRFGDRTAEELNELLAELDAAQRAGLILDLRRNPGGSLDTAVRVGDEFLSEGLLLIERFGDGSENEYPTTNEGLAEDVPLVLLIDEGTASASEVLAGAIRDRDRGTLIGQPSFGKGTVQTWAGLTNGGGVRITIARWLTPGGVWVHETGLQPDILVTLPETEPGQDLDDTQLQAAVDFLLGRPVTSSDND